MVREHGLVDDDGQPLYDVVPKEGWQVQPEPEYMAMASPGARLAHEAWRNDMGTGLYIEPTVVGGPLDGDRERAGWERVAAAPKRVSGAQLHALFVEKDGSMGAYERWRSASANERGAWDAVARRRAEEPDGTSGDEAEAGTTPPDRDDP